ncbi:MAG: response regulator transcription factor [Steroidobacteraceae bacterium]|jgi:DNA-binding NarL/FixJ family response regulator
MSGLTEAPLRVLIGENNADLAMTLTFLLDESQDIRCVARASSNRAVLEAVEAHAPNAFVMDLSLDDGSSLPLIKQLRERLPAAAIVVYTGHKNTILEQQCLKAGADAVVVKGGDIEELTAALRRAAQQSTRR